MLVAGLVVDGELLVVYGSRSYMLVLGAALGTELTSWARSRHGAAGKCSEISLLNGAIYTYNTDLLPAL